MRLQNGEYYVMRNGLPVGPIEEWNPVLRVAYLIAPLKTDMGIELNRLTWNVCGESTYKEEYDIIKQLKR